MSKEKVDAYKEQKKHRKENLAKERARKVRNKVIGWVCAVVVAGGLLGALGLTGYNQIKAKEAAKPDYSVTTQVVNDYTGITAETQAE